MLVAIVALVGTVGCGDDPAEGNNGNNDNNGNNADPCEGVSCEAEDDFCDGDVAVTHTGAGVCDPDSGECDYSAVEERTDCTDNDQVCDGGECVDEEEEDLCEDVTCEAQDDHCDGDTLISHTGAGTCDPDSGECDYSDVEETTDCTDNDQVCDSGACVDPEEDLCEDVTCEALDDYCDGDTLISHTDAGMCVEDTGECDYSDVEETTDCTDNDQICDDGECVDEPVDPCDGVTCEPEDPSCDGDVAVTHTGAGTCTDDGGDAVCDYSGVEDRTDCTASDQVCQDGACVDSDNTAPVASDDTADTDQNVDVTIDVLANDTDADTGDTLTVDSVTQPANGSVTNNGDDVTYTPDTDYVGSDTFDYTVSDDAGATDTATVTVTVNAVQSGDCLIISEYVEDGGTKAVELYNCGSSDIDLTDYRYCSEQNDRDVLAGDGCNAEYDLTGTLATNATFVLCGSTNSSESYCDDSSGAVAFNGDDRFFVFTDDNQSGGFEAANDTIVDAFGELGVRPSSTDEWGDVTYDRCNFTPYDGTGTFVATDYYDELAQIEVGDLGTEPSETCAP
ncbi:MAG: Ig-like domain-containing protein [Persicimonas sp.]